MWQSKLQSETAFSTMEAEVIVMAACMRELVSIIDMVVDLARAVGLSSEGVNMNVSVHEDNSGALVLAETLLLEETARQSRPNRSSVVNTPCLSRSLVDCDADTVGYSTTTSSSWFTHPRSG